MLTVLSGAVLVPYQLSELERVRQIGDKGQQKTNVTQSGWLKDEMGSSSIATSEQGLFIAVNDQNVEVRFVNHFFFVFFKKLGVLRIKHELTGAVFGVL